MIGESCRPHPRGPRLPRISAEKDAHIDIRPLEAPHEFRACVALQRAIWGEEPTELVPPALLQVCQKVSGIAAGAFERSQDLIGFVFGLTGIRRGELVHWSHLLAVRADRRDSGVGLALKKHQRAQLLQLGISKVYWSFDPLEARNAHLNLNRLGVGVEQYVPDMYGPHAAATPDAVIGTDRLVVRWDLGATHIQPPVLTPGTQIPTVTRDPLLHRPGMSDEPPLVSAPQVCIEVPSRIQELKRDAPDAAVAYRLTTRRAFVHYLSRGYQVSAFHGSPRDHVCRYVLTALEDAATQ